MLNKRQILGSLAGAGLLLGTVSGVAATEMPTDHSASGGEFERIEQPLGVKLGAGAGGLFLIGLELWWVLLSKPKAKQSSLEQGIQKLTVQVDGGYEPSQVVVKVGQPVQLNFFRRDPSSCLEKVLIPDFRIAADLPLNQETAIEFTPDKLGEYAFIPLKSL
ncbi:cupredoxin domain-containing protein [Phormidium sp. CLA17]|uniref:cupredoxin domain-containing protein n=1 Tax=Leptolyngbya sp. Cla-17 TaxID=2803751 RepID=UPI001491772F|nr:cupredoxin domain-containing protein [Leptolyngbya sp. Cla-17]MBM0742155.1 cupredoxin domain-containing protein [Leptolyngbya sp. Cla-17]